jgi:ABC-type multidrug transport system fused ATPase/permease subunit
MKMAGLEGAVLGASSEFRAQEVKYLARRKYLDSACVFLWALTPVIVPFVTFLTTEYMGVELTASDVITALALLNMLIFPMNALPWVINGFMEARVSMRRLAKVLSSEDGSSLLVNNRFTRKSRLRVTFSDANLVALAGDRPSSADTLRRREVSSELRRDALLLSVPATVWSWTTTHQMNVLFSSVRQEAAPSADLEAQVLSPLLAPTSHISIGGGVGEGAALDRDTAADQIEPPFAVSVNEIKLRGGQLFGIVGSTGSGKTSLLLGILGEIRGHKRTLYRGDF